MPSFSLQSSGAEGTWHKYNVKVGGRRCHTELVLGTERCGRVPISSSPYEGTDLSPSRVNDGFYRQGCPC